MVCFAGIDMGSAFSKAVILKDHQIEFHVIPSVGNSRRNAEQVLEHALSKANISRNDLTYVVATGYGAANARLSHKVTNDMVCHAKGVSFLFPAARSIVDFGAQFTRVLKIDGNGRITKFLSSDKCAAGSGRFLQIIAKVLQMDLADMGELSLQSREKTQLNAACAVFGETEVVSRIAEGALREDILAGIHHSLASRAQNLLERLGWERDCVLTGGGAKNIGLVGSLENLLGCDLLVPEEPQITAALGAALLSEEANSLEAEK